MAPTDETGGEWIKQLRDDMRRQHADVARLSGQVLQAIKSYGDLRDTLLALVPAVERLNEEVFGDRHDSGLHDKVKNVLPTLGRIEREVDGMPEMKLQIERLRGDLRGEIGKMQQQIKAGLWVISTAGATVIAYVIAAALGALPLGG